MYFSELTAALDPRMGLILLALWVFGFIFKRTPVIKDWLIIYLLVALGIAGAIAIFGLTLQAIIQGIIAAALACLAHQLIKQGTQKRITDDDPKI